MRMKETHFSVNSVVMQKVLKEAMVQSKRVDSRGSPPCGLYNRHFFNRCRAVASLNHISRKLSADKWHRESGDQQLFQIKAQQAPAVITCCIDAQPQQGRAFHQVMWDREKCE